MSLFAEPFNIKEQNIVFINASQNKQGNTVKLSKRLLVDKNYDSINLVDYKIYPLGQNYADDDLGNLMQSIKKADVLVIGTPIYWHSVSGALKNLIDTSSQDENAKEILKGKKLYFFAQGRAPSEISKESIEYMITRYADVMGLTLVSISI